jgi:uroporphyrin-3 C-methyltransferase
MANSNEARNKVPKTAPKAATPDNDKTNQPTSSSNNNIDENAVKPATFSVPMFSLVIAVIALISGLYAAYTSQQLRQATNQQTQALSIEINQLNQKQLEGKINFTATVQATNQIQEKMQKQVQELSKNLHIAMQQRFYQKQDWVLLKARYYLELAQINSHWSNDQQATIALLQQADALLMTVSNQQLFGARQAIAQEITQLQTLPKVDVTGLLSQLDAARRVISDLPAKQAFKSAVADTKSTDKTTLPTWREKLNNSMHLLEKLVVVRHSDEEINSLLSPIHQTVLRESIGLNLQEAQWAILQNNPQVYQLSLIQAMKDIKRAFDEKTESTQALLKQLQNLAQEKLIIPKPTLEESLLLLNQLIESNSQAIKAAVSEGDNTQ